jgi:hypothetical protein
LVETDHFVRCGGLIACVGAGLVLTEPLNGAIEMLDSGALSSFARRRIPPGTSSLSRSDKSIRLRTTSYTAILFRSLPLRPSRSSTLRFWVPAQDYILRGPVMNVGLGSYCVRDLSATRRSGFSPSSRDFSRITTDSECLPLSGQALHNFRRQSGSYHLAQGLLSTQKHRVSNP